MHHYTNRTIKLILFSLTLVKTQQEELAITCVEKIKTEPQQITSQSDH